MPKTEVSEENKECGIRYKFLLVQRDVRPHRYAEMDGLLHWCAVFDQEGMAPLEGGASAGNLSFRTTTGFVITPTRVQLKAGLSWEHLIEVVRANWLDYEMHFLGTAPPSSDSFLHERIYRLRPDVTAVLHGHDDVVLTQADALAREFDIAVTPAEMLFGTKEDALATAAELGSKNYIIRKGHGFVSVGRTLDEAGNRALEVHRRADQLSRRQG